MADFETPQSRNEAILQNILGADNDLLPPQSRIEKLLLMLLYEISIESAKVYTYSGATPPTAPGTIEGLKIGDFCVCWLNAFLGLYTCTGITSTVKWERVDNVKALVDDCKAGTNNERLLTPSVQDASAFYGMAKAAGDSTQSASSNPVGTYTDEAKTKIMNMLGDKYQLISTDILVEDKTVYTKVINGYENIIVTIDKEEAFVASSYMTINVTLQNDTSNYQMASGYGVGGKKFITGEWERKSNDIAIVTFFTHSASGLLNRRDVTGGGVTQVQIIVSNDNLPIGTTIKIYGKGKV